MAYVPWVCAPSWAQVFGVRSTAEEEVRRRRAASALACQRSHECRRSAASASAWEAYWPCQEHGHPARTI